MGLGLGLEREMYIMVAISENCSGARSPKYLVRVRIRGQD